MRKKPQSKEKSCVVALSLTGNLLSVEDQGGNMHEICWRMESNTNDVAAVRHKWRQSEEVWLSCQEMEEPTLSKVCFVFKLNE